MTFTYVPDSPDYTVYQRSLLRLLAGDAVADDGPRPDRRNYADNELDIFLLLENSDLNRASARIFETLAGEWARYAGSYRLGPESEEMRQSAEFSQRAAALRAYYGYTTSDELGSDGGESGFVDWTDTYRKWVGKF